MAYAWVITKDLIEDGKCDRLWGPRGASKSKLDALDMGEGVRFRLLDDDGEVYYEGRIVGALDSEQHSGFEPLEDLGYATGCTEIHYFENGRWARL